MESFLVFTTSFLHLKIVSRQIFLTFLHVESLKPVSEFPEVLHAFGIPPPRSGTLFQVFLKLLTLEESLSCFPHPNQFAFFF